MEEIFPENQLKQTEEENMKQRGRLFFILVIELCILSCNKATTSKLEKALQFSGNNRSQLEEVLNHFARNPADSLKLKAAIFLIENMPGHYSTDSLSEIYGSIQPLEDIRIITSSFLITHIESVFRLKANAPWLKDLDSEIFFEYLLPYRTGQESMEYLESSVGRPDLSDYSIYNYNDSRHSINALFIFLRAQFLREQSAITGDNLKQNTPLRVKNQNRFLLTRMRNLGIPMATDFNPLYPSTYSVSCVDACLKPYLSESLKKQHNCKIYRETYSSNPVPSAGCKEYIPPFFRNPFLKDVTDLYLHTSDIRLNIADTLSIQYAYLAGWNGKEWQAVAYSQVKNHKCHFTRLGKNTVYLPVYFPQEQISSLSDPFILRNDGQISYLCPTENNPVTISLSDTEIQIPSTSGCELQYFRDNYWITAGKSLYTDGKLTFSGIPAPGLYRIKDPHSQKFSRIFTWEKGKVRFW